jgi:hypothetical protein
MASASNSRQVEGAVVLDKRDACRETNIAYAGIRFGLNDGVLVVRFAGIKVPLQFLILVAIFCSYAVRTLFRTVIEHFSCRTIALGGAR